MSERRAYNTDLSEAQWALVGPLVMAWKRSRVAGSVSGYGGEYEMREIVNAILYQTRTGCQWSLLPHDLPPLGAVKYYYYLWRDEGLDEKIHEILRCQVREQAGRTEDPSAVVLDSQSVRAAVNVPAATTGKDAGKKTPGRKRGIAVDVIGLIIAVVVFAASVHDNAVGTALLDKVAASTDTVGKAWVDQGFKQQVVAHGAGLGIDVEIVERNPGETGFVPQAKRWVVEQRYGILMLQRRLVRDYESDPRSAESRVYWASSATLVRRLTATRTVSWRGA